MVLVENSPPFVVYANVANKIIFAKDSQIIFAKRTTICKVASAPFFGGNIMSVLNKIVIKIIAQDDYF